jgi:hypothetical protein
MVRDVRTMRVLPEHIAARKAKAGLNAVLRAAATAAGATGKRPARDSPATGLARRVASPPMDMKGLHPRARDVGGRITDRAHR